MHKTLTPGLPVGRPPGHRRVTGQKDLCLCAFFFPDVRGRKRNNINFFALIFWKASRGQPKFMLGKAYVKNSLCSENSRKALYKLFGSGKRALSWSFSRRVSGPKAQVTFSLQIGEDFWVFLVFQRLHIFQHICRRVQKYCYH